MHLPGQGLGSDALTLRSTHKWRIWWCSIWLKVWMSSSLWTVHYLHVFSFKHAFSTHVVPRTNTRHPHGCPLAVCPCVYTQPFPFKRIHCSNMTRCGVSKPVSMWTIPSLRLPVHQPPGCSSAMRAKAADMHGKDCVRVAVRVRPFNKVSALTT